MSTFTDQPVDTRHKGRKWADHQFLLAMGAKQVPRSKARVMWLAVRLFGWIRYRRTVRG